MSHLIILFQGDSITDAGRNYKENDSLGNGYVMMVAGWLSALHPDTHLTFLNRGMSGNRVKDLKNRWQKDCVDLQPNIISILIGINDVLTKYVWSASTPIESFESDYRAILEQTRKFLNVQNVIVEPFLLHVKKEQIDLREDLNPKIESIERLSKEFDTILVPLDAIFNEASKKREPTFWARDGIHPTLSGHALIAQSWIKAVTADLSWIKKTFPKYG